MKHEKGKFVVIKDEDFPRAEVEPKSKEAANQTRAVRRKKAA